MADSSRIQILSRQIKNPGRLQMSAKDHNLTPQSFAFGATLSPTKRNQVNQVIMRMHFNGAIEPIIKRWNGL